MDIFFRIVLIFSLSGIFATVIRFVKIDDQPFPTSAEKNITQQQ